MLRGRRSSAAVVSLCSRCRAAAGSTVHRACSESHLQLLQYVQLSPLHSLQLLLTRRWWASQAPGKPSKLSTVDSKICAHSKVASVSDSVPVGKRGIDMVVPACQREDVLALRSLSLYTSGHYHVYTPSHGGQALGLPKLQGTQPVTMGCFAPTGASGAIQRNHRTTITICACQCQL